MKMDNALIDAMILDILTHVDYDTAKQYKVETAEEPEFVEGEMSFLRSIVRGYLAAAT